jgi:hypothetical protein
LLKPFSDTELLHALNAALKTVTIKPQMWKPKN